MVLSIETRSIQIEAGVLRADLLIKTDRGLVANSIAFKLSEHPELDSLLPLIDREIRTALAKSCGLAPAVGVPQ